MNKINITLPDKSIHEYEAGVTALQIAKSIGERLAMSTVAASVNNTLVDATIPINEDSELIIYTGDSKIGHEVLLHSTAHLMAQAVKKLWPDSQMTIGPVIENRFYYDFDIAGTFSDQDLSDIEDEMRNITKKNYEVLRHDLHRDDAIKIFSDLNENYKVEIINDIESSDQISAYKQGDFIDLCRGPHVPFTGNIKYFKLLTTSGAYWRGDENNKMLQRIYGTVFSSKSKLKDYLYFLEESKKRDHRKIGKELEIFTFDDEVGPGLPLWLPNGGVILNELELLAKETEDKHGYLQVRTPHLTKGDLYKKSGHLDLYKDAMYPAMDIDGTDYYVKPMNCPHHHKIYSASPKSYRDLPYRISEYGTCYRYEKSGQLFGLMRVRSMQMNDAHIYCSDDQFSAEFLDVCNMYLEYFKIFGIEKYEMRLSLHDPKGLGKKYIDEAELWVETESIVRNTLIEGDINFIEIPGEAAFYGPKVDVQVWSAIGKEFTLATNQVDFAIPKRFDLTFMDNEGKDKTPLCIHRAPLSTHERFVGFLIEHYGGDFPVWLSPVQIAILPVSEKTNDYAYAVQNKLKISGFRTIVDDKPDKIGSKIRNTEIGKIPIMLILGEKEAKNNTVSIRRRFIGDEGELSIDKLINDVSLEIKKGVYLIGKVSKIRINEKIRASEVRLISETGEQLGVVKLDDAIIRAKDVGLDLIEVSPNAKPPVAKILNFGKLKYEEKKKQQASKKKQHVVKVKEIRVRPRIDTHDLETKVNLGRKFILAGCKLKVTLMYRGRELSRTDLGLAVLNRVREMFSDIAEVEKEGSLEGRRQTIVLTGK